MIGTGISVTGYFFASRWLASVVESKQLAQAYAMLAGLAGSLLAGVICARIFPPKRVVTEQDISSDPAWRAEVLAELENQPGGLGRIADLPAVVNELKELKLYDLFADAPKKSTHNEQREHKTTWMQTSSTDRRRRGHGPDRRDRVRRHRPGLGNR